MQKAIPTTSYNFTIAKVVAIFVVAGAHFLPLPGDWIAASVALFVFGFSSSYFTSAKYHDSFRLGPFWRRKLYRLGPDLLVINLFLLGLFLVQGKQGIWTWQTLTCVFGVKGFLTWFGLGNPSPYGGGLWFLTLLLLFYAFYPGLRFIGRSRLAISVLTVASVVGQYLLTRYVSMGHGLWFTAWSFLLGVWAQRLNWSVPVVLSGALTIGLSVVLLGLNLLLQFKQLNPVLIVVISISTVSWLKDARLPKKLPSALGLLSGCLLEIYLLHSYFFLRVTGYSAADFLISMVCVTCVSLLLAHFANTLRALPTHRLRIWPSGSGLDLGHEESAGGS